VEQALSPALFKRDEGLSGRKPHVSKEENDLARYRGPVCRLCRREGMKLFLKGERCHSEKCAIERRNFVPGQHGKDRKAKLVGYGLQLREKQKVRRIYGVLEAQFRITFEKAARMKGITGENLLSSLERRLDSVLYRMGLATSRAQGRQTVRHGHIQVNGRKVNIPSFLVKPGDEISVRESSKDNVSILSAREATAHAPSPGWMDVDRENLKGRINSTPRRDELTQIPINEQLIVELYSK
jgi:small subunit ribosomal protein S4